MWYELVLGKRSKYDFYLAASFLAYGISAVVNAVITLFFDPKGLELILGAIATFLPPLLGGSGAAYVIIVRVNDGYLRTGITVGLGSFFVDLALSLVISGLFEGALWILLGYLSGGVVGSRLRNRHRTWIET